MERIARFAVAALDQHRCKSTLARGNGKVYAQCAGADDANIWFENFGHDRQHA
jgi:hypothetical protein